MNVFHFELGHLEKAIKNRKDLEKEDEFLRKKFQGWGIDAKNSVTLDLETLKKIVCSTHISEEESARLLVNWAEKLGAVFKSTGLSSSQIRNFFGEVKSIQQQGFSNSAMHRRFVLLLPKLEYARARAKSMGVDGFSSVMSNSIRLVNDQEQYFERFAQFFEAILAYHRAFGGK